MPSYQTYTLGDLITMLKQRWESVPFWTDAEAAIAINEGIQMWNLLTGMWKARVSITTTANQQWVTIPTSLTYNMRVNFNEYTLEPASLHEMDSGFPNWEGEMTNDGGSVPTAPKFWIPVGLNLMAIWPGDHAGSNGLILDGITATPTIAGGAYLNMPASEVSALLGYALHSASFKDAARWSATMGLYKDFLIAAAKYNNKLNDSALYRQAMGLNMNNSERADGRFQKVE